MQVRVKIDNVKIIKMGHYCAGRPNHLDLSALPRFVCFKRFPLSGMIENFVLNSTTPMVSWTHFPKLFQFIEMRLFVEKTIQGDEEQDTLVYLPEGLAKGGKRIPLSASFFDHKDISAGEPHVIMIANSTTLTV